MDSVNEYFKKSCSKNVLLTVCWSIALGFFCVSSSQQVSAQNVNDQQEASPVQKMKRSDYRLTLDDWLRLAK